MQSVWCCESTALWQLSNLCSMDCTMRHCTSCNVPTSALLALQDLWGKLMWLWNRPSMQRLRLTISMANFRCEG
jgi:hypothetical protein